MARRRRRVQLPELGKRKEQHRDPAAIGGADWEAFVTHVEPLNAKTRTEAPTPTLRHREIQDVHDASFLQAARRGHVAYTVDLHGLYEQQAYDVLTHALHHAQEADARRVLVITGKGEGRGGVLRQHVPRWLQASMPEVQHCTHAPPEMGGEGALIVTLTRKR